MSGARAAFIDRDGVVNALVPDPATGRPESPLRPEDVTLIEGVPVTLRQLAAAGWVLIGVSNQPAAAKGTASVQELHAVQSRVLELLAEQGARFDAFRICLHHPDGIVPELSGQCECRKPAPGMLRDAAQELGIDLAISWMIGDTDSDVLAGQAAGCQTALVEHRDSFHKRGGAARPDVIVPTLAAAGSLLLSRNQ